MHKNLAQIARTCLAASLLIGNTMHDQLQDTFLTTECKDTRPSNRGHSFPSDIIKWNALYPYSEIALPNSLPVPEHPPVHTSQLTTDTEDHPTSEYTNSQPSNEIEGLTYQDIQTNPPTLPHTRQAGQNDDNGKDCISKNDSKKQQQKITSWTHHRPQTSDTDNKINIQPYGTPLSNIDSSKKLRLIIQNTQYALQLTNDASKYMQIINNLKELNASIFVAISPNINFCNPSNRAQFKQPFSRTFHQVHLSTTSSNVGHHKHYFNRALLPGGVAILTLHQWASKISDSSQDKRGHGTYTTTTILGENGKKLTIIGAYISVQKGSQAGINTVHAQQTLLMETENMKAKQNNPTKCPRREAIKVLSNLIHRLQDEDHAIILAIDANQTPSECRKANEIQRHTIEWLRVEHDLMDPFVKLTGTRPPTTTLMDNRDIDYVLTYGIDTSCITTLPIDSPANSDHLGIAIDIDTSHLFNASYDPLGDSPRR